MKKSKKILKILLTKMSVIAENFTIQQGETFSRDFILKNPDQSLVGISSYTSTGFLAKYAGDSTTYPFTTGITTSTSTIRISLASTITATLDAGRYYYNVFTVDGSSVKKKQREGNVLVNASVLS
jgi:hypothetical protein